MESLIYFGKVKSTKDEKGLGRVQVEIYGYPSPLELPWLRMVQAAANDKGGFVFLPEVGDEVAILRGMGDHVDGMLVLGCLYHGKRKPAYSNSDGKNITKQIRTRAGNEIILLDKSGEETITIRTPKAKLSITMESKSGTITLEADKNVVVKSKKTVTVESKDITVTGKGAVKISAKQAITVDSKSEVTLKAPQVKLPGNKVEIG